MEKRLNKLIETVESAGPGRVECPYCGAVKNLGDYVLRPGVTYTFCPSCSNVPMVYVQGESTEEKELKTLVCNTCDKVTEDCQFPCDDKSRMLLYEQYNSMKLTLQQKIEQFEWNDIKSVRPLHDQICVVLPAKVVAKWHDRNMYFYDAETGVPVVGYDYWIKCPDFPEEVKDERQH